MTAVSNLEQEIAEQPAVLARRHEVAAPAARAAARLLRRPDVTHLIAAARGSSDNAARYAQYLLGPAIGLPVYLATPSLFATDPVPRLAGAAVLGISQSGQSPDIAGVLKAARAQRRPTLAITNDEESPLARTADVTVPLLAGPERSVAATKTFTATLAAIAQIGSAAAQTSGGDAGPLDAGLAVLPGLLSEVLAAALDSDGLGGLPALADWTARPPLTAVGRGTGLATATETALKIREVTGIRTEAFALPDLLHGPIAAIRGDSVLWLVGSPGYPAGYWNGLIEEMARRGVRTVAVAPHGSDLRADCVYRLPRPVPGWLFDLVAVGYGQVAALRLGELLRVDVDAPAGLSKVTLTR